MKKIISSIILIAITLLIFSICVLAAGQLEATIDIIPTATEVAVGDEVVFTFVTKDIANAEFERIFAIGGIIEYDKTIFELESYGMLVDGETGEFICVNPVGEGGTNGTITLKVINNATGKGIVKFTDLVAADGRIEGFKTLGLGMADTKDKEFSIILKETEVEEEIEVITEEYKITDEIISNIQPETTVQEFRANVETNATEINVYNKENEKLNDSDIIGTGMKVELKKGDKVSSYTIIVKGDTNGDGKANITDIFNINSHRLGTRLLTGVYLQAADVNGDEVANVKDIFKINSYRLQGGKI